MISFADQFGEQNQSSPCQGAGKAATMTGATYFHYGNSRWAGADAVPTMKPPAGLVRDWRQASDGGFAWQLAPAGDGLDTRRMTQLTAALRQIKEDLGFSMAEQHVAWVGADMHNPLAAMCHHKDTHSTERLPQSTAKEAPQGICAVAGFDHRPGAWK